MCGNEAAPFRIDDIGIRESENRGLDAGQHSLGLAWSEAESIVLNRSSTNRPELDQVLRCDAKAIAVPAQLGYGFASLCRLAR
jgi:hypothetical protein